MLNLQYHIHQALEQAYRKEILWQHEFLTTYRKNGEIILTGSPRNTIDEQINLDSWSISRLNISGITLENSDPESEIINFYRPELELMILDKLDPEQIATNLIISHLKTLKL